MPYVSNADRERARWMTLNETLAFIRAAEGCSRKEARRQLGLPVCQVHFHWGQGHCAKARRSWCRGMLGSWLVSWVVMLAERDPRSHYLFEADLEGTRPTSGKVLLVLLRLDLRHIFSFGVAGPIRKRTILGPHKALAVRAGSLKLIDLGLR